MWKIHRIRVASNENRFEINVKKIEPFFFVLTQQKHLFDPQIGTINLN